MPSTPATARALVSTILASPLSYANEAQLQAQLATALTDAGYEVEREVVLADGVSRIDLQVGRVGIEVKVKGSLPDIRRQLARYARDEGLDELILVTTRSAHHGIPTTLGAKPLTLCSLVGMRL